MVHKVSYLSILKNETLKKGEFWNFEILEFYIKISQQKVQLYYFREFITGKYVLLKTRTSMERKDGFKIVSILEYLNGHKVLIRSFDNVASTVEDLIDNTNFNFLIDVKYATAYSSLYDENKFIYLNLCKKVPVVHDNNCGYESIANSIGISTTSLINQLSQYYMKKFDGSTDLKLVKAKKLIDWVKMNDSQPMPDDLILTTDDSKLYISVPFSFNL